MSEFRRLLMAQSSEDDGWTYGVRYASMKGTSIVETPDPDYRMSPYYPYDHRSVVFYDNNTQTSVFKEFNANGNCLDYWRANNTIRTVNLNANTTKLRFCMLNANFGNSFAMYLDDDPELSYYLFRSANFGDIINTQRNIILYHRRNNDFVTIKREVTMATLYQQVPLDTSVQDFNKISFYLGGTSLDYALCEYDTNNSFIDYWVSKTAARNVTLNTNARYVSISMNRINLEDCFIRYQSTGEYIWKGNNV